MKKIAFIGLIILSATVKAGVITESRTFTQFSVMAQPITATANISVTYDNKRDENGVYSSPFIDILAFTAQVDGFTFSIADGTAVVSNEWPNRPDITQVDFVGRPAGRNHVIWAANYSNFIIHWIREDGSQANWDQGFGQNWRLDRYCDGVTQRVGCNADYVANVPEPAGAALLGLGLAGLGLAGMRRQKL